ncbi:MAG: hypothetical protein HQL65_14380 [Magnetococcales bacterium]|nr:hypothetical protein [Magnetococcales bacterium]
MASRNVERLKGKIREEIRKGRGRNLGWIATTLAPILRGWIDH